MKARIKFIIMKIFMKIVKICPKSPWFTVPIILSCLSASMKQYNLNILGNLFPYLFSYQYCHKEKWHRSLKNFIKEEVKFHIFFQIVRVTWHMLDATNNIMINCLCDNSSLMPKQ